MNRLEEEKGGKVDELIGKGEQLKKRQSEKVRLKER